MKIRAFAALAAVAAALFTVGIVSLAVTGKPGSADDPLITLSYLNDVVKKQMTEQTNAELTEKLAALESSLAGKLDGFGSNGIAFKLVELTAGQTLTLTAGSEVLLRTGGASCGSELIDSTDGTTLAPQAALTPNHLYVASADVSISGTATALVRGAYSLE
ncbi:MAG: hypothetical protein LBC65_04975 [Oscillospiraceae bacterium]|jgi:hypothetical protein|nr:hypothetical protein [Oscillospiraceae bacterium]